MKEWFKNNLSIIIVGLNILFFALVTMAATSGNNQPEISDGTWSFPIICLDGTEYLKGYNHLTPHYKNGVIQTCQK